MTKNIKIHLSGFFLKNHTGQLNTSGTKKQPLVRPNQLAIPHNYFRVALQINHERYKRLFPLSQLLQFILHLDSHLAQYIAQYGNWTYALFFCIIFCETGFVIAPFLPGDSLLFIGGTFAGIQALNITYLLATFILAAILGNSSNYILGRITGQKVFQYEHSRIFSLENLKRTHAFFEKYGGKTLIITRFIPILRSFAPFVAGVGAMNHIRFQIFNLAGAVLWVGLLTLAGYYFGNLPAVRNHLTLATFAIICLSFLPGLVEYIRLRKKKRLNNQ
ncbi:MAG: DedA family protein [Proteobacteria bacterium]|nr:DedA family protein [Pseudomonadota bacterium]